MSILSELADCAKDCTKCKLHSTRNTVVFGGGDPNASIMIVGEAPGEQEDETGLPFVGRSGKLLDKMLEKCFGITREKVYIANIVKCRPPDNRDPDDDEMAACRGYLEQQITLVDPVVIITLGRVASQTLLDSKERIGKLRGKKHNVGSRVVVPSWHPSYLLRRPAARWDTVEDMKLVQEILTDSAK